MAWACRQRWIAVGAILLIPTSYAAAQCAAYDFEEYPVGMVVTGQYDGVTFSTVGNSCGGNPPIYLRIAAGFYGDSFESKVLLIDTGCPDFSPDYLRMVFDESQRNVRFTMGLWGSAYTYAVRLYSTASGGAPLATYDVNLSGSGFVGAQRLFTVTRADRDVRRIEIQCSDTGWEAIDNLEFGWDDTPPTVQINVPGQLACLCGRVTLRGIVCDYDGAYDRDRLEYRRVWPQPQVDWTLVGEYIGTPVCTTGSLYQWDTTTVPDGVYVLRATAINACGLATTADLNVHVNNGVDTLRIDKPLHGAVLGGAICLDGTVWERACFDWYRVEYRPVGGAWAAVDPSFAEYTSTVTNQKIADWVVAPGLADGDYDLRVLVQSDCTAGPIQAEEMITVTLDNTAPTAVITAPVPCATLDGTVDFYGTAHDANLDWWELQYYDPFTRQWEEIDVGLSPVNDGLLGSWDTTGLPSCAYCVRLRVWDRALLGICDDICRHRTDHYLGIAVGDWASADLDLDGDVDIDDFGQFSTQFTGP